MKIDALSTTGNILQKPIDANETGGSSFQNVLNGIVENVNNTERQDGDQTLSLLTGDANDLHTAMITMEKADIALQFTVQIRNKIVEAYNEIMRMQV